MAWLLALWAALGQISGVAHSAVVYAAVSAAHILGIALVVGPILLVDLRLIGLALPLDSRALTVLRRTALAGTVLAIASGLLLASARPADYVANPVFLAKLAVIALGLANAVLFEWAVRRQTLGVVLVRPYARLAGLTSLLAWPAALALGRWIAFT